MDADRAFASRAKDSIPPYVIGGTVSHTLRDKSKLLARVRRIRGQVEAVERALETELGCADVLQLIASVRGAVGGLTAELIEDHINGHILGAANERERRLGAEELIDVVRSYLK